jgi:DNA-binding beta-propeller fold protein YncE
MSIPSVKKVLLSALLGACSAMAPAAWSAPSNVLLNPFNSNTFVVLPSGVTNPEGIAFVPTNRSLIVGTLTFGGGANSILRYNLKGKLLAQLPVASPLGSVSMTFNPRDNKVYFVNPLSLAMGTSLVQRVPVDFTASTPIETVAMVPFIAGPGSPALPNGLTFRASDGALFIADSLQGAIFQIPNPAAATCPNDTSCVSVLKQDPMLASTAPPTPNLGANSILVSNDESVAYITNTNDDRVLTLNLTTNQLSVFAENVQGADGLAFGPDNSLLVSAFLGNEVVALDLTNGRVLAKFGGFRGIDQRGIVKGLLNNGSIAVVGNVVFACNLALPDAANASNPVNDVQRFSVAKIFLPRRFAR